MANDIIPITKPPASSTIVKHLEELIRLAKEGKLDGYALAYVREGSVSTMFDCGGGRRSPGYHTMLGAVSCLHDDLLTRWRALQCE